MLCPSCKTELPDDSNFCNKCGYNFNLKHVSDNEKCVSDKKEESDFKTIVFSVLLLVLIGGGVFYYQQNALNKEEKIAYDIMTKCSLGFKNPSSLELIECYVSLDGSEIRVRAKAENGFGAHTSDFYLFEKDGKITGEIEGVDIGKLYFDTASVSTNRYKKIDVSKVNKRFRENH